MAPPTKPPGQRVRRNLGQPQHHTIVRGSVPVPSMAALPQVTRSERRAARAYWRSIWTDLGETLTDADRFALTRLCVMHAQAVNDTLPAGLHAELRQLESAFGLSPTARRRLMLAIRDAEPVQPVSIPTHRRDARDRRDRLATATPNAS